MSLKILLNYFDYCKKNKINPTFEGLNLWHRSNK